VVERCLDAFEACLAMSLEEIMVREMTKGKETIGPAFKINDNGELNGGRVGGMSKVISVGTGSGINCIILFHVISLDHLPPSPPRVNSILYALAIQFSLINPAS
jgi:hypothetical protein